MRQIAKFYTWFWIVYFPVCIAFTNVVKFDLSDELLTVMMVIYAFRKNDILNISYRRKQEIIICAGLFIFYFVYSWIIHVNTEMSILLDFMQEARPYLVFYITWVMAPQFTDKQKKWIKRVMLLSLFTYIVLMFVNPQFVNKYAKSSGLSESAQFGQLALCCAMVYYLFSTKTRRNQIITILILILGLLSGKSKYFGEIAAFIFLLYYVRRKIHFGSPKIVFQVSILAVIILFLTWTKFEAYFIEGFEDTSNRKARPETYKASLKILFDYAPFGSGFGTFGCAAAAKEYSPLYYKYNLDIIWGLYPSNPIFLADTFYPIYIAQFGFLGIIMFFYFWKRRLREANGIMDLPHYRMALMCILALALEQMADSSYVSGKGMGYFMILALCLNSNRFLQNHQSRPTVQSEANVPLGNAKRTLPRRNKIRY